MKYFWLLTVCMTFGAGLGFGKVYFSKTIIVTKEVRVSAFPEGINLNEICDGYYGSYANELKEQSQSNIDSYEQGYKEGMKKRELN